MHTTNEHPFYVAGKGWTPTEQLQPGDEILGLNENTNGLLRQHFPKEIDFRMLTKGEHKHAVHELNHRPRKKLPLLTLKKPVEHLTKSSSLTSLHLKVECALSKQQIYPMQGVASLIMLKVGNFNYMEEYVLGTPLLKLADDPYS